MQVNIDTVPLLEKQSIRLILKTHGNSIKSLAFKYFASIIIIYP